MPLPSKINVLPATKARAVVRCSTRPDKRYELLMRVGNGRAVIGAKRAVMSNPQSQTEPIKPASISGRYELTNGVTLGCIHCDNPTLHQCSCGADSCSDSNKNHTCPSCERSTRPEERTSIQTMRGSNETAAQKRLDQSSPAHLKIADGSK